MVDFCRRKFMGMFASIVGVPRLVFGRGRERGSPGLSGRGRHVNQPENMDKVIWWYMSDKGVEGSGASLKWKDFSGYGHDLFPKVPTKINAESWVAGGLYSDGSTCFHDSKFWISDDVNPNTSEPGVANWTEMTTSTSFITIYDATANYNTIGEVIFSDPGTAGFVQKSFRAKVNTIGAGAGNPTDGTDWEQLDDDLFAPAIEANSQNGLPGMKFEKDEATNVFDYLRVEFPQFFTGDEWSYALVRSFDSEIGGAMTGDFVLDGAINHDAYRVPRVFGKVLGSANESVGSGFSAVGIGAPTINQVDIIICTKGSSGNPINVYKNGTFIDTANEGGGGTTGTQGLTIGHRGGGGFQSLADDAVDATIYELFMAQKIWTAQEINDKQNYLQKKWNAGP